MRCCGSGCDRDNGNSDGKICSGCVEEAFNVNERQNFIPAHHGAILKSSVHTFSTMSFSQLDISTSSSAPFTDYSRWRLVVDEDGRHSWKFLRTDEECTKWPQKPLDKFWIGLPTVRSQAIGLRPPLTLRRNYRVCLRRKRLSNPHGTGMNTTNTCKHTTVTGPESTAVLCSSSQGSPSGPTLLACHSQTKNVSK